MLGIDMNRPIAYIHSSLRYFSENEHHVDRLCPDDVLVLVFGGVLRFTEDGVPFEIHAGQYHIQKHGSAQSGPLSSDRPRYLYVHFLAQWADQGAVLPRSGIFDCGELMQHMKKLDAIAHGGGTHIEQSALFFELLSRLYTPEKVSSPAGEMAAYLSGRMGEAISLSDLCSRFHFSKNHIIHLFRAEFGLTPVEYLNRLRLQKARHLLESTAEPLEAVALDCGFRSYSHFYRMFCRESGMPPIQWRQKSRIHPVIGP